MQASTASDRPICLRPMLEGWKSTSGTWNRSLPIVKTYRGRFNLDKYILFGAKGEGGGGVAYCKIRRSKRALIDKPLTTYPLQRKCRDRTSYKHGWRLLAIREATLSQERGASCAFLTRVLLIANGAGGSRRTGARECLCTQTRAMRFCCCCTGDTTCTLDSTDLPRRTREPCVEATAIICRP